MRLFIFDLLKNKNADTEDESTRSRLAGMRAHSETKKSDGTSDFMERVRGLHTELLGARRRTSKDYWFLPQSEVHNRLDHSLDTGALAHLESPE